MHFNPRAPCGARHACIIRKMGNTLFQSTRPLRGATMSIQYGSLYVDISIHAPLAGRDVFSGGKSVHAIVFQSTRPLRGATAKRAFRSGAIGLFQSTRPLRGATVLGDQRNGNNLISIHAPLAGRDLKRPYVRCRQGISIHAPLAGRDDVVLHGVWRQHNFNPRAPCGARQQT